MNLNLIGKQNSMRFVKRDKSFKSSNCEFNYEATQAYSYGWWRFVDVINGKIVFNSYNYSPSTCKHQSKVRRLLSDLGLKVDYNIEAPKGLQDLESAIKHYEIMIKKLIGEIQNPRSRKATNERRASQIESYKKTIEVIKELKIT